MGSTDFMSYGFAVIVFSGGLMGFIKAGSMMSLGSGIIFGSLIGYGAYKTSANPNDCLFLLVVSLVLMSVMGYRYINSGKLMPAGLVAGLSAGQVVRLALRYIH